ncbi:MAG: hypothetical protein JJU40_02405 [Rhodobacteraceae bacterium]|nr:hypothetical protein [Paracoccaceae bacterium]
MEQGFRERALRLAHRAARLEQHRVHLFPHPIWDGGDRIQIDVWEDPEDSPDFFAEFNQPLCQPFRDGLGRLLEGIAQEEDAGARSAAERALEVDIEGFWMERDRIEEGIIKRMFVVTGWTCITDDGKVLEARLPRGA